MGRDMKNQNILDAIIEAGGMAILLGLGVTVLLVLPSVFILYALHMIYSYYTLAEEFVVVTFVLFTIFFIDFAFVKTSTETDRGDSSTITTIRTDDRDNSISGCSCIVAWGEIYEQVKHDSVIFEYALGTKSTNDKKTIYEIATHSIYQNKQMRILADLFPNISVEEIKSIPDISSPESVNHLNTLSGRYLLIGIIFLILGIVFLANAFYGTNYTHISLGYEIFVSIFFIVSFPFFIAFIFYENEWKRRLSFEFKGKRFYKIGLPTDSFPLKLNRIEEHYVPSENDSEMIYCPSCYGTGKKSIIKTIYAGQHRVYDRTPSWDEQGHEDLNTFHLEPTYKEVTEEVECTVCKGTKKVPLSSVAESFNRSIDNYNRLLDKLIEKFPLIHQWKDEFNEKLDAWNSKFGNYEID